ncbi:hypothetical protein K438DRAFT_818898 [Mycena galopus ATCC 62051]|nr:hypothetical protein K438DRAFT_818898 [Mycena galopus ATCC 62051]
MASGTSFNLDSTLGAYEIGVLVSYVLLGVTTTQVYTYYCHFRQDSLKVKAFVAFVYLCEVAHAICLAHALYIVTISDYDLPVLERVGGAVPKSFPPSVLLSGIIGGSVQSFFAFRIYRLSKKLLVPIVSWAMSALRMVMAAILTGALLHETSMTRYEMHWQWAISAGWSVSTVNDLMITGTLVAILIGERKNTYKRTAALVDKIILYTIETGVLTSLTSIAVLTCFISMPDTYIYAALFSLSARLFSNSLLASLNSRTALRAMEQAPVPLSFIHRTGSGLPSNSGVEMAKEIPIAVLERSCLHCGHTALDAEDV